jgi:hypothetical protein
MPFQQTMVDQGINRPTEASTTPSATKIQQIWKAGQNLKEVILHVCAAGDENLHKESGISGLSIFTELTSIIWPQSFCIDTMHLVLENLSLLLFKLWTGYFSLWEGNAAA